MRDKTKKSVLKQQNRKQRLAQWYEKPKFSKWHGVAVGGLIVTVAAIFRKAKIPSARLDAELILAHAIRRDREYLYKNPGQWLSVKQIVRLERLIWRRLANEPIAYITGCKEFYRRNFIVNKHALIPRPETEQLVELAVKIISKNPKARKVLDVGTGSGCIGITLKLERPELDVTLSDISKQALRLAKRNTKTLRANVRFIKSDLLDNFLPTDKFDLLIANLPYVNCEWRVSSETKHEPDLALFAGDDGLALIKKLIKQSSRYLNTNGRIIMELDPRQKGAIKTYAVNYELQVTDELPFAIAFQRRLGILDSVSKPSISN